MTYSSPRIPFLAGNYPTEEDRKNKGGLPIVVKRTPSIEPLRNVVENYKEFIAPPECGVLIKPEVPLPYIDKSLPVPNLALTSSLKSAPTSPPT